MMGAVTSPVVGRGLGQRRLVTRERLSSCQGYGHIKTTTDRAGGGTQMGGEVRE